jgi:hypothetical protein
MILAIACRQSDEIYNVSDGGTIVIGEIRGGVVGNDSIGVDDIGVIDVGRNTEGIKVIVADGVAAPIDELEEARCCGGTPH